MYRLYKQYKYDYWLKYEQLIITWISWIVIKLINWIIIVIIKYWK